VRPLVFIAVVVAAGTFLRPAPISSQEEKEKSEIRPSGTVTVDLSTRSFGATPLPFDVPFQIRGKVAPQTDAIYARYGLRGSGSSTDRIESQLGCALWTRELERDSSRAAETEFAVDFPIHPLDADKEYLFEFTLYEPHPKQKLPVQGVAPVCSFFEDQKKVNPSAFMTTDSFSIRASTQTDYTQRFDTDIGIVHSSQAGYTGFASNVHFHLWPLNKSADLADFGFFESLKRRISVFGGLAVTKLGAEEDVTHLMGVGSPMVGLGFRAPFYWQGLEPPFLPGWLIRPMRLNAGVIWFNQDDPNPLVDETTVKHDAFVSLSYDVDVKSILGPFVSLLPK
jgi:hypothetical protein